MSTRRLAIGVVAIAAILLGGRALSILYDSFTWYNSLGAGALWAERATDTLLLSAVGFLFAFAFTLVNLAVARQGIGSITRPRRLANVEFGEAVPPVQLRIAAVTVSAAVALVLMRLLPSWKALALARLGVDFREADPYFHHDLSFYVTWLPFERAAYSWTFALVVCVSVIVVALYLFASGIRWSQGFLEITPPVRRHLGVLAALLLLVCTWNYRLAAYDLLSGAGPDSTGFSYMDHRWMLPGLLALSLATAAIAIVVAISAWMGQLRTGLVAIMVAIGLAGIAREIVPFVFSRVTSQQTMRDENVPYVVTRQDFTRRAFGTELDETGEAISQFAALPVMPLSMPMHDTLVAPGAVGMILVDDPTLDIAGPSLGNGLSRLAHAWAVRRFGLLSDSLRRRARIVTLRDVRERVATLYPLFFVGPSPRPLFRADTLFWSVPLYSASNDYPLADKRPISGIARSYFHRAGTALVNARTGRVFGALDVPAEPVAAAWIKNLETPSEISAAQTVQRALSVNTVPNLPLGATAADTTFRSQVIQLYDRMRSALSAGDLRGFGTAYDSFGALVGRTRK
jgi:uncharacterized membrane protein (UPF0182 family)